MPTSRHVANSRKASPGATWTTPGASPTKRATLTVIKTYLGIIDERLGRSHAEGTIQPAQRRARPGERPRAQSQRLHPITPSGPAHSGVAEILHDLRALYGEALFGRKGIHFELRTSPNLPAAAISPDALKQVFLNLFKNAAEAIPEGGKLTVSAVAGINANGSPCMEIRIVDNGPGLAPERVETLFDRRCQKQRQTQRRRRPPLPVQN